MKLWKSVVGKLWMTIIGLVAVVLVINGVFMGQFLNTNIANSKDQERSLQKMALKVSSDLSLHHEDFPYVAAVAELLDAQDAALIVLNERLEETIPAPDQSQVPRLLATDLFDADTLKQVLAGGIFPAIYYDPGTGKRFLAVAVPQRENVTDAPVRGVVVLYQAQLTLAYTQAYFQNLFVIAAVIGFLLTTLFAFFLSTKITQPLLQMKKAADFITLGEYKTRVPVSSSDEIGELAVAFNHMTGRLDETINALNHEKEHLSSVLRSMTDAVVTLDADGRVILTNPQGERLVEEWRELGWEDGAGGQTDGGSPVPQPLQPLFETVVRSNKETTSNVHVRSNVYSVVMAPLYSTDGLRGTVAVLRDVTEEHRLDKLRKDFVANVSHELRTPLSMLQGYSEALLDDIAATPEERRELAQVIHDESLRMGRLVKDLLDLARMEAGHIELHFRRFALDPLLARVNRKFTALCKERGIALKVEAAEPDMTLYSADEDRLEQVLTNLLDNAVRHTPSGSWIALRVKRPADPKDESVLFEIEDGGQGIPREDLPYIFERFYKADKARTRGSSGGTGLGLAIVKNIVDAHNGSIHAESELGQGTTFFIKIPNRSAG
ncbi:ATP-binding protein [Paenibacillus flagellatus]|uniref:histidine kinase n=1 Tax=Paenibacillus flagellatus TaxID=2211139 RepID=A0A2V5KAS9_9BACL|nr:ATP-binding protein [Paenibacillus flagellatus]PYI54973.1 two-component sensor histidine kinase [Paenibacillus flagellatus]